MDDLQQSIQTMKTYDLFTITTFGAIAVVTFIGGFYNWVHFIFCGISVLMIVLALCEYKQIVNDEKRNGKQDIA